MVAALFIKMERPLLSKRDWDLAVSSCIYECTVGRRFNTALTTYSFYPVIEWKTRITAVLLYNRRMIDIDTFQLMHLRIPGVKVDFLGVGVGRKIENIILYTLLLSVSPTLE